MGPLVIPAITTGLSLLSSLFKNKPQEYRQTPLQSQLGAYMQRLLSQGGQGMSPDLFAKYQQAYAVPQQAQWAMNLLPQIFGGMNFGGQGMGGGQMPQGMGQMPMQGGGGQQMGMPQMSFGNMQNPFAMNFARGGIAFGPTNAMIGEAGPEAVIPLRGMYGGMGQLPSNVGQMLGQMGGGMGQPQMNPFLGMLSRMQGMMQPVGQQPRPQSGGWGGQGGGGFAQSPFQAPWMT